MQAGRVEEARRCYLEALTIHREFGDRRSQGVVLGNLGVLHNRMGRNEESRAYNLGTLRQMEGQREEAREHYEAAIAILREVQVPRQEAIVLCSLGSLHDEEGRVEEARASFVESERLLREVDEIIELGNTLCTHGVMEWRLGETETARAKLREAEELAVRAEAGPESAFGSKVAEFRSLVAGGI